MCVRVFVRLSVCASTPLRHALTRSNTPPHTHTHAHTFFISIQSKWSPRSFNSFTHITSEVWALYSCHSRNNIVSATACFFIINSQFILSWHQSNFIHSPPWEISLRHMNRGESLTPHAGMAGLLTLLLISTDLLLIILTHWKSSNPTSRGSHRQSFECKSFRHLPKEMAGSHNTSHNIRDRKRVCCFKPPRLLLRSVADATFGTCLKFKGNQRCTRLELWTPPLTPLSPYRLAG